MPCSAQGVTPLPFCECGLEWSRPKPVSALNGIMEANSANPILPGAGVPRNAAELHPCLIRRDGGASLNSPERGEPENMEWKEAAPRKIICCKKPLKIATHNIQTLKVTVTNANNNLADPLVYKTSEICNLLSQQGIEIYGMQETRWKHDEERRNEINNYPAAMGYTIYTSSAWVNSVNAATGGIALVIGRKAQGLLISVDRISDRVMKASFIGNPALTVLVAYAPTETAEDDMKTSFYRQLRSAIENVSAHNFLAILGDFNARFGPEDVPHTYNSSTNDNGLRLLEVLEDYQLQAANTQFCKRRGKLWTWRSPYDTYHQIDYILVRTKWRKSVTNCEAYSTFSSIYSDHRVLTANLCLKLRAAEKEHTKPTKYVWSELLTNRDLQKSYAIELKNRYQALQVEDAQIPDYSCFVQANRETAEKLLTQAPKCKREAQNLEPRVVKARAEVEEAYKKYSEAKDDESLHAEYKAKKEVLYGAYAQIQQEELTRKVKEVEEANASSNHGAAWKLINDITGKSSTQSSKLKASSSEERVKLWHKYFKNLLGNPPNTDGSGTPIEQVFGKLSIRDDPFDMEEYVVAKRTIKCGKSCGDDGITPEFLKYVGLDDIILGFINKAYSSKDLPREWKTLIIVPVPKSGDLTKPDNYRGISLISLVMKLYNRMILNRLRPILDPLLHISQNGFRQKRSTIGQIVALRRLIEGAKGNNLPCILTFIDFRKAFDTIHRGKLIEILRAYGVPDKMIEAIEATYSETWAKVRTADGETETFQILAGVLQGDTLAPFLFIVALDSALRRAIEGREEELGFTLQKRASRRVAAKMVTDLDFADDIALLSDTVEQACTLLLVVEKECKNIGLGLNAKKTKVMPINIKANEVNVKTMDGTQLDVVDDFKYLGSWVASTEHDIKVRRAQAWKVLHDMKKIWKSRLSPQLKRRVFVASVESVLLYGCETWSLTVQMERSLDGVYTRMLRMVLNVSWEDHAKNVDLYGALPRVTDKIRARRMGLAGHCVRHPELVASNLILWEPKHGTRSRGRPATTYIDTLRRDTGLSNTGEIRALMINSDLWRAAIRDSRVGVG